MPDNVVQIHRYAHRLRSFQSLQISVWTMRGPRYNPHNARASSPQVFDPVDGSNIRMSGRSRCYAREVPKCGFTPWIKCRGHGYSPSGPFAPILSTDRADISNGAGASVFISIHANGSSNPTATGPALYVLPNLGAREAQIKEESILAQRIGHQLKRLYLSELGRDARYLGVKQAPFVVLIGTHAPAVLAEIGFVTGPEGAQLMQSGFRNKVAKALYDGITSDVK